MHDKAICASLVSKGACSLHLFSLAWNTRNHEGETGILLGERWLPVPSGAGTAAGCAQQEQGVGERFSTVFRAENVAGAVSGREPASRRAVAGPGRADKRGIAG